MTATQLAWLAGWLEGEGSFLGVVTKSDRATRKDYRRVKIAATSTDKDVIDRVASFAGGRVYGPYSYGERKPSWQWVVGRTVEALALMRALRPFMGSRRQGQIDTAIEKGTYA